MAIEELGGAKWAVNGERGLGQWRVANSQLSVVALEGFAMRALCQGTASQDTEKLVITKRSGRAGLQVRV